MTRPCLQITLCMVNYNGERYLKQSLGSVFLTNCRFQEVLLIDNASKDRSLEIVGEQFPGVTVTELGRNLGPAVARNTGYNIASCDRILFVDNDVILGQNCSDQLTHILDENSGVAVAMPRILYADNQNIIQFDGADSHFLGLMALHNANRPIHETTDVPKLLGSVVTACFLVDRKRLGDEKPFDDDFFFSYEDHDFGLRTRSLGLEIMSVPSAVCYHLGGTEGLSWRPGRQYPSKRVFFLIRNRWQIIIKHYAMRTLVLLFPILLLYEVLQFAGAIKKGWLPQWGKGLIWVITHLPETLRKRRMIQKVRRTPDREILVGGPIPFTAELTDSRLERMVRATMDRFVALYWKGVKQLI